MKFSLSTAVFAGVLGAILSVGLYFAVTPRNLSEGVDIAAGKTDSELSGHVTVSTFGTFTHGKDDGAAAFIASYATAYDNGKTNVVKYVLAAKEPFQTRTGRGLDHYVLYQYFREDGSLEHEKLVNPEPGISGSVWTKTELTYYSLEGKVTERRFVRPDGTLGLKMDESSGNNTAYFADGLTPRTKQVYDKHETVTEFRYLKDGKVWYETRYDKKTVTKVYFDNQGKPLPQPLRFIRMPASGRFKANGIWYERVAEDTYLRPDGSPDYVQTWFEYEDKNTAWPLREVLGQVQVYNHNPNGAIVTATYNLDLRSPDQPRFIKSAQFFYPSGGTLLWREYSTPNHRSKEVPTGLDGKDGEPVFFNAKDKDSWYEEPVPDIIFQGFNHDAWGNPDANSHDF